jgi:hypothetical protein
MIAPLATSANGRSNLASRLGETNLRDTICKMHRIICDPGSKSEDVERAKRVLLNALAKQQELPRIIIPPIAGSLR